ncbi:MAG: aminopeptidase P family protein [Ruminococcus sp.]|nr:aminopeptidase P family protein [Ruminococcus sp.]
MNNINKLQSTLCEDECALLFDEVSRRYFTKMKSSAGTLVVFKQAAYLLIDFRYYEKAKKIVSDCEVIEQTRLYHQINELVKKHGAKKILLNNDKVTLSEYFAFKENLKATVLQKSSLSKTVTTLRNTKTDDEKEKIIHAQRIAEKAYLELLNYVRVGMTEREVALELNRLMFYYGAEDLSFETIALAGANTSVPHGTPGEYKLSSGDFLLLDFGAQYDGYHSDMTRTVAIGEVDDKKREVYDIVLKAQLAGIERIKSGAKCSFVDAAARDIINAAGFEGKFGHSFGHGVGLEIHENPNLSPNNDTSLISGMVVTAEPGIYLESEFGVRIEDFGMVTESGFENFTKASKQLTVIG